MSEHRVPSIETHEVDENEEEEFTKISSEAGPWSNLHRSFTTNTGASDISETKSKQDATTTELFSENLADTLDTNQKENEQCQQSMNSSEMKSEPNSQSVAAGEEVQPDFDNMLSSLLDGTLLLDSGNIMHNHDSELGALSDMSSLPESNDLSSDINNFKGEMLENALSAMDERKKEDNRLNTSCHEENARTIDTHVAEPVKTAVLVNQTDNENHGKPSGSLYKEGSSLYSDSD